MTTWNIDEFLPCIYTYISYKYLSLGMLLRVHHGHAWICLKCFEIVHAGSLNTSAAQDHLADDKERVYLLQKIPPIDRKTSCIGRLCFQEDVAGPGEYRLSLEHPSKVFREGETLPCKPVTPYNKTQRDRDLEGLGTEGQ